jgi:hypothetical protein
MMTLSESARTVKAVRSGEYSKDALPSWTVAPSGRAYKKIGQHNNATAIIAVPNIKFLFLNGIKNFSARPKAYFVVEVTFLIKLCEV